MPAPTIPLYSGTVPNRNQSPGDFADNADDWLAYQSPLASDYNGLATYLDALSVTVDGYAVNALNSANASAASASEADGYADIAQSSANFKGEWSSLTGGLSVPSIVLHNGANWQLLVNLANVTLSEPSLTNSDWAFLSGTRWLNVTANYSFPRNIQLSVLSDTVATDLDLTQPTWQVGDYVVIKNSIDSTEVVRLLNPSNTIKGQFGTVSAGDDMIIPAGDTVHLIATATNVLETV